MSYEIEKGKVAFIDRDNDSYEPYYFCYNYLASNNVRPRIFEPHFIGYNWKPFIIEKICKLAGYCETGSLKPYNKWIKPENYIKSWRNVLQNPMPIKELNSNAHFRIALTEENFKKIKELMKTEKGYRMDKLKELFGKYDYKREWFVSDYIIVFNVPIKSAKNIQHYKDFQYLTEYNALYFKGLVIK